MSNRFPFAPGVIVGGPRRPRRRLQPGRWLAMAVRGVRAVALAMAWTITIGSLLVLALIAASLFAMAFFGVELYDGARTL